MYDRHVAAWRCKSCGYDNDLDSASCVYCGELNHGEPTSFDDIQPDEELDEL